MQMISPEILADAKGLSIGAAAFFLLVGAMLWSLGWRWHRFWIVFALTVTAGLLGIAAGRSSGTQVLVVGVLLAIVAGMLALEVARIVAFLTCGLAAWIAAQAVMPEAQELWAVFLCGGLVGVVLYKFWTMLATAAIGSLFVGHAALILMDTAGVLKADEWATKNAAILNGWFVVNILVGIAIQTWTGRGVEAMEGGDAAKAEVKTNAKKDEAHPVAVGN